MFTEGEQRREGEEKGIKWQKKKGGKKKKRKVMHRSKKMKLVYCLLKNGRSEWKGEDKGGK